MKGGQLAAAAVLSLLLTAGHALALSHDVRSKAVAAINRGDFDAAITVLEGVSSEGLFDEELKKLLARAYAGRGWARINGGKYDAALGDLNKARIEEPEKDSKTYLGMGFAYYQLKRSDEALYYINEALNVNPSDKEAHELLGQIYYERGRLGRAIEEWNRALELEPDNQALKGALAKAKRENEVEGSFSKTDTFYFSVKYDGDEKKELGDLVLEVLYRAKTEVGGDLGYYPRDPVTVILYTRQQFADTTNAPAWAGGIYDGIIRLPIGGTRIDKTTLSAVLYHEYTHAVMYMEAGGRVPVWLNEGLAQYEERWARKRHGKRGLGQLMPLASLSGTFMGMDDADADRAYAQSLSAVEYYVSRYGMYSLSRLVKTIGEGKEASEAMQEVAGVTLERFDELWRQSMPD